MCQRFAQCSASKPQRSGRNGRSEDIERSHRDLESFTFLADPLGLRHAAVAESQRGERMRRDHVDALLDLETRRIGIDNERSDSLGAGRAVRPLLPGRGPCEHAVEIGDAAVRNPGLGAVQDVVIAVATRRALHRRHVRARLRLRQSEGRDRAACRYHRQVARSQGVRSGDRYRAAAEALHRKGEVGQPVVFGERLAHQADRACIEVIRRAAIRPWHTVARESCIAEVGDEPPACSHRSRRAIRRRGRAATAPPRRGLQGRERDGCRRRRARQDAA